MILLKPFYFMRHAETDWNREGLLMGSQNIPINQDGLMQIYRLLDRLGEVPFDYIISSPLQRARETAEIIAKETGKKLKVLYDLRGCSWGDREGRENDDSNWYARWRSGELVIDGAETYQHLFNRVTLALKEALEFRGIPLIIGHGGGYSVIQRYLGVKANHVRNCKLFYHIPPRQGESYWKVREVQF